MLLIGNSITQGWGGSRDWVSYKPGQHAADENFLGIKWIGAGISGDKTENVAWRVANGHYNKCQPDYVVLTIGVNNFSHNSAPEISDGLKKLLSITEAKFPNATILFFGPLPTGLKENTDQRNKFREIHKVLAGLNYSENVNYFNVEELFCEPNGTLNDDYYSGDGIHLKSDGYMRWAKFIMEEIDMVINEKSKKANSTK